MVSRELKEVETSREAILNDLGLEAAKQLRSKIISTDSDEMLKELKLSIMDLKNKFTEETSNFQRGNNIVFYYRDVPVRMGGGGERCKGLITIYNEFRGLGVKFLWGKIIAARFARQFISPSTKGELPPMRYVTSQKKNLGVFVSIIVTHFLFQNQFCRNI